MVGLVRLVLVPRDALAALVARDLDGASAVMGLTLPEYLLENAFLWRYRLAQLDEDPRTAPWLVGVIVRAADDVVVGHAGFHGPPDEDGMVEIGYSVAPSHRRRGYARAAVEALIERAGSDPAVRILRASVAPGNVASLRLIESFGLVRTGEQIDDLDGLELIYERPIHARGAGMHD